jgi:hypothetical protein
MFQKEFPSACVLNAANNLFLIFTGYSEGAQIRLVLLEATNKLKG